jgi:high-affinity nickel permease
MRNLILRGTRELSIRDEAHRGTEWHEVLRMTITAVSVVVAVLIGVLETLNLIGDQLGLTDGGGFSGAIGDINDSFGLLSYVIIGVFLVSWVGSVVS